MFFAPGGRPRPRGAPKSVPLLLALGKNELEFGAKTFLFAAAAAAAPAPIWFGFTDQLVCGKFRRRSAMCVAAVTPGRPGVGKSHSLRFIFLNATICWRNRESCEAVKPDTTRKMGLAAAEVLWDAPGG